MDSKKTAIILMNMGGPGSLEDIEPFLYNLFMDPDIINIPLGRLFRPFIAGKISKKRSAKVRGYYEKIGGRSPLPELTMEQAVSLRKALGSSGDFDTFVAMRYWHPFTVEAIKSALEKKASRLVLLPLYPQYSTTTTGSSINEFRRKWKEFGKNNIEVITIKSWHDHSGYIGAWVESIRTSLKGFRGSKPHIIFSAHGIPAKLVDKGDPYRRQTEETVRLIIERLEWDGPWHLSYQSRVGPVKWLEPATDRLIEKLAGEGTKSVLMVPVSFVSDHSETLYEMDIQYRKLANEAGIDDFRRAPSLNNNPLFIDALKDIVLRSIQRQAAG